MTSFQDGFITWNEYKSEEFDLDDLEDERTLASDPERIEVRLMVVQGCDDG